MLIVKPKDVNRYTMEYLTKIETFAKKYDVLVMVVAHPTKMYRDKEVKLKNQQCIVLKVVVGNGMMLVIHGL